MRKSTFAFAALFGVFVPSAKAVEPGAEFFEKKIRPVLVEQCYSCHSEEAAGKKKLKGGLRLDTAAATRKGGEGGPGVVPGKPGESLLLKALNGGDVEQMPPKGKLPPAVIADFETWIKMGAPDPRSTETPAEQKLPGINLEKGRKHWSFQPPKAVAAPQVKDKSWARGDLDRFVQAKLEEKGLKPAPTADKSALVRRVYFDLTGLPPTPEAVASFVSDSSPDAYRKLVDKLLASPQYGERWARHWLDVARYAEDQAHTFAVQPKINAWRYRDWVIQSLNADMPYDQFVKLQIAGDLVPESAGDRTTRLAGLGFLGLGAEYYKNTNAAQAIADELDDRIDTVTRGFLGLTVSCARCHDHKFDPIPTQDYYSLAGIFNGSQLTTAPLAADDEVKKYDASQAKVKEQDGKIKAWLTDKTRAKGEAEAAKVAKYLASVQTALAARAKGKQPNYEKLAAAEKLDVRFLKQWAKYLEPKNASKATPLLKTWFDAKPETAGEAAAPEFAKLAEEFQTKLMSAVAATKQTEGAKTKPTKEQTELIKAIFSTETSPLRIDQAEAEKALAAADATTLTEMKGELERRKKDVPPMYPVAHVLRGGGQTMKVYVRGNPAKQGDMAPKGFLQVVPISVPVAEKNHEYNRLDLASAIASRDNPLTARVIVNRVWAQHFGRGLVNTPGNLGALGDRPSHPELLDWLAVRFMENGWSLKWLHREIVTSVTYCLSSTPDAGNAEKDADNVYLWRANRRRLEVEPWRDALLAVAGRLDATQGGPTTNLRDSNNTRRTVYAKISRHELDGLLRLFDFPDANVTAEKRTLTTVPQQQLFVLNSDFMVSQAKAFAERVKKAETTDEARIRLAYQLAYGRQATPAEVALGVDFLKSSPVSTDKLSLWEQYAQALLAANEFMYVD
ncbi:PSD1 and planctomycete cytochrome C domain-containing protein [Fimbriiglobus ruber]|uniref:Cytochrome c domain-containing protein n=1 Tax=Fimbriiglobus ruber TaxID=1908690 RepID=A0A225EDU4_9BACT|nr:PSD1 and planctomycete cytochrome C domain-containing protein [Fimbriiglobus ruber]OWK47469.1 hypothetical protein FRUB_01168 [Fimbriiglobus ruber]